MLNHLNFYLTDKCTENILKITILLMPVKSYLERKTADITLTVMDWSPRGPDLNIIEVVWDHLDRERNKGQPKSKEVLKEALYNIPENY